MHGPRPRAILVAGLFFLAPAVARAHFTLVAPACATEQDDYGSPQKLGPCGNESGSTPTGKVTTFQPGETINVTIDEKIFHPGHYRISLSVNDRSELPPEPPVTAGSTPCGSAPIDPDPEFPVLADGVLVHTTEFSGPQTVQVRLPTNVTCEKCTLQVLEFMSQHGLNKPGGCYYHHCADIAIKGDVTDAAPPPLSSSSSSGGSSGSSDSGGCATAPASDPVLAGLSPALLLGIAAVVRMLRTSKRAR